MFQNKEFCFEWRQTFISNQTSNGFLLMKSFESFTETSVSLECREKKKFEAFINNFYCQLLKLLFLASVLLVFAKTKLNFLCSFLFFFLSQSKIAELKCFILKLKVLKCVYFKITNLFQYFICLNEIAIHHRRFVGNVAVAKQRPASPQGSQEGPQLPPALRLLRHQGQVYQVRAAGSVQSEEAARHNVSFMKGKLP